ncbi:MAG: thiol-disulfide oxidoreductase DCC family protein [Bacillaceae bacterium]
MMRIILFDGECNLCHHSVQFILKRDSLSTFHFCSLQSEHGKKLLQTYHLEDKIDSFVFIDHDKAYTKSLAALHVCKYLNGWYPSLFIFRFVPTTIRDFMYTIIARNRYKWFGKRETCMIPTPEFKKRFLD